MASDRTGRLGPEAIARTTFQTSFRGYDQEHVRAFLDEIAAEMREARDREAALRQQVESLRARVAQGDHLDEARLTAALGEETARVLTTAREAAAEIRTKAEESAARMLKDATEEAARLRSEAEDILSKRTEIAEHEAESIRARAEEAAEAVVATARAEAERITAESTSSAAGEVEAARATGRLMVQEAQAVRERVLKDLARKRRTARAQLEQLRAGRERLVDAYDLVRRTLDEATGELRVSLSEAKLAADAAARRVEAEPEQEISELEAEVEAARMAGLTLLDTEPAPELEPEPAPAPESPQDTDPAPVSEPAPELEPDPAPVSELEPAPAPEPRLVTDESLPPLPDEIPPPPEKQAPVTPPRRARRRGVPELPPVEYTPLSPPDPVEGMRVITGETPAVVLESPAEPAVDVDDLFARIKAARAEEVAKAEEVLSEVAEVRSDATPESTAAASPTEPAPVDGADVAESAEAEVDDDQALLERRDGLLEPVEARLTKLLRRAMADEQSDILDKLRRSRGGDADSILPAAGAERERYSTPVEAELVRAATAGASFHGDERDAPDVADLAAALADSLAGPIRERIVHALRDANGDEEAAAEGVRSCFREWKSQRLGPLVADSAITAFNRGVFHAVDAGRSLRWVVDNGGTPCPDAEDNALAGLVPCGEMFPTGHGHPPAHPGCRCMIVPAASAE